MAIVESVYCIQYFGSACQVSDDRSIVHVLCRIPTDHPCSLSVAITWVWVSAYADRIMHRADCILHIYIGHWDLEEAYLLWPSQS